MGKLELLKRRAGLVVPIFSLNEPGNWGIGEINHLYPLIDWMASFGQTILQVLPFNEMSPGVNSPYSAMSLFAIDPVYITIEGEIPADVKAQIDRCRKGKGIQYEKIRDLKLQCLGRSFEAFKKNVPQSFRDFEKINGWWLHDYAMFRLLKEKNNWYSWQHWAPAFKNREKAALDGLAAAEGDRILFFKYVQWVAFDQWDKLKKYGEGKGVLLKGDVPFAPSEESEAAWVNRDIIDPNFTLGCPPDAFSATGQEWGLPVYHIGNMEATNFEYWRRRAHWADELFHYYRIDHVVGCYRMYAFPTRRGDRARFIPEHEAQQLKLGETILYVLKGATRNSYPMAEDLGVIPDFVRESLSRLKIPGYKIMRWEKYWKTPEQNYIHPCDYPECSIATTGSHDTDTMSEWWETLEHKDRAELIGMAGIEGQEGELDFNHEIHMGLLEMLYHANSLFVILPIQDLFGWSERINVPGTCGKTNWSYRLPGPVSAMTIERHCKRCTEKIREFVKDSDR